MYIFRQSTGWFQHARAGCHFWSWWRGVYTYFGIHFLFVPALVLQIRNWQIPSWVYLGCSEIQFFVSNNYPKFKVAVSIWESKCLFVNKRIAYIRQVNSNLWRLAVQSSNNFTDKIETVRVCATYYYSPKGWVSYYHNRRILKSFRYKYILKLTQRNTLSEDYTNCL